MAVVNLESLYDDVLPFTPGATAQIALYYIRLAAREFCTRTRAWNFITDPLDVVAGEALVDSESIVSCAEPVSILQVWYKDADLPPMGDAAYHTGMFTEQATPQRWIGMLNAIGITLWPTPATSEDGAIKMRIALRPIRTASQIDADLYAQWHPVIAEGAKARMFLTPKKPYSDATMAKLARAEFMRGVADARWKKESGNTPITMVVRPPPFGV